MWNTATPGPHGGSDETRIDDPIDDAYDAWKAADAVGSRATDRTSARSRPSASTTP
jgi:hypothetical protein